jgi:Mrp family chromosome partitioning ATPase
MGRMLDALRRGDGGSSDIESARGTALSVADAEPILVATEEIPFIEVGPRKSMEASPSVLACAPAATPTERREESAPSLPALRNVQFRALPGRRDSRSSFAAELVAFHAPNQAAAQQYRAVLDAVVNASTALDRPTALLFTSALPRGGTTNTLLNLAILAAAPPLCPPPRAGGDIRAGRRVVVVDANFRRPAVAERLGLPAAPGLREAMAGAIALDEAIQTTEQANLLALTAGVRESNGVRFVADTLHSLLRQLRQRYPLVFVDGPRWDGKPDIVALAAACDAVFLVTPESEAETPQTEALLRLIPQQGARLAGCILVADPDFDT